MSSEFLKEHACIGQHIRGCAWTTDSNPSPAAATLPFARRSGGLPADPSVEGPLPAAGRLLTVRRRARPDFEQSGSAAPIPRTATVESTHSKTRVDDRFFECKACDVGVPFTDNRQTG